VGSYPGSTTLLFGERHSKKIAKWGFYESIKVHVVKKTCYIERNEQYQKNLKQQKDRKRKKWSGLTTAKKKCFDKMLKEFTIAIKLILAI
jgi:hypothetical protein